MRPRLSANVRLEEAISALGEAQHGVFALRQLMALGVPETTVQDRARARRIHRLHHGVYSMVPRSLLAREALWMAAVLAAGPGAVLSHRSAAALHELRSAGSPKIEVLIAVGSHRDRAGLRIRRSRTLTETDVTVLNGIPCTTVARTLLDLGAVLGRRGVERACDQAEILGTFDLHAVGDQLERNPKHRGRRTLTAVVAEHYIGATPTWSELEEAFLALARRAGLPVPEVNVMLDLADGEHPIRVDFLWRRERLVVETDGRAVHGTAQAFERDRRRDQRLMAAAFHPLRFSRHQVVARGDEVARTLCDVHARLGEQHPRPAGALGDPGGRAS